jgi:SAM-dependent methyltransferase
MVARNPKMHCAGGGQGGSASARSTSPESRSPDFIDSKRRQLVALNEIIQGRRVEEDNNIKQITHGLTHGQAVGLGFDTWATTYDEEMVDHVRAIVRLIAACRQLETVGYWEKNPIFGKKFRDFSIGTGAIEDGLPEILSPEFCMEMIVHGNDLSGEMNRIAEQKLQGKFKRVNLTVDDLASVRLSMAYETAVLSQTLPFIPNKATAISKVLNSLAPGGTGLVIDEWPPKLTVGDITVSKRMLFGEMGYFNPISMDELRNVYLGKTGRVEGQIKLPIPPHFDHDMYLLLVRKVQEDIQSFVQHRQAINMAMDVLLEIQKVEPWASYPLVADRIRELCPRSETLRKKHKKKGTYHTHLRTHYLNRVRGSEIEGSYNPMILDPSKFDEDSPFGSFGHTKDTLILNSVIHMLPLEDALYGKLARVVKPGKNLIIIDRWPPEKNAMTATNGTVSRPDVKNMLTKLGFDMKLEVWVPINEVDGVCVMAFTKE